MNAFGSLRLFRRDFFLIYSLVSNSYEIFPFSSRKILFFLLLELMNTTTIHSIWRIGCVLSHNGDWALLGEYSHSGCICMAVRSAVPSAPLVDFLTSLITQLIHNYYPKFEYKLTITCTHCVQQRTTDPWSFPVEDCEAAILSNQTHITCKQKSPPLDITMPIIVPDLALLHNENIKIKLDEIDREGAPKTLHPNPAETISCMIALGNDIWVAHGNGDISIWNSENGALFRRIVAAHSRQIQTMVVVGGRIWSGSKDGMINVWMSRSVNEEDFNSTTAEVLKEGYLEPANGCPAFFVKLYRESKELCDGVVLAGSQTVPTNEQGKNGFVVTLPDGQTVKYFCANVKDRDEWVSSITHAKRNLCEETKNLKIKEIPPTRRYQIHTLCFMKGKVWAGGSDPHIRVYDAKTFTLLSQFPILPSGTWKNASVPGGLGSTPSPKRK